MRIAIFSDNFYPELSGIADSILATAKKLAERGHQIDFYVPSYSVKDFAKSNLVKKEIDLGPNIIIHRFFSCHFPTATGQGRIVIPTLWRWLKMRAHKPDIIHTHLFFGMGFEALAAAKFLKLPLVGTNHTAITEFVKQIPIGAKFLEKLSLKFVSWFYNKCDFVSAPAQGILNEMMVNGFIKPSQVIYNPADIINFYPAPIEEKTRLRMQYNFSDQVVLCVGRIAPEKHVDVVIRAINLVKNDFPDINLLIVGHGSMMANLKQLVQEMKLEKNVKFLGTLNKIELAKIYRTADLLATASTSEIQSLCLIDAFASAIPAVGVNARGLAESIDESDGFVVEPGDYRAMAEKIIFLLKNPEISAKMGRAGNLGVQEFSEEKIASKWEEIYQQAINNKKPEH